MTYYWEIDQPTYGNGIFCLTTINVTRAPVVKICKLMQKK